MRTPFREIVKETSVSTRKKEKMVYIVVKHFFRAVMRLPKEYLSFKGFGMFHLYRKKKRK